MSLPASSSSLPTSSSFQLHGCRWAWCSSIFPSSRALVHHVLDHHIRHAVPVKRADLPMLQRAEEGVGESLSFSGMMNGISPDSEQLAPSNELESSLPSPPPSLSHPSPHVAEVSPQLPTAPSPPSPELLESHAQISQSMIAWNDHVSETSQPTTPQPGHKRMTPTFKSLASTTRSPSLGPIPESPSLNSLVASATNPKKRKFGGHELTFNRKLFLSSPNAVQGSESSKSSQESRDSVEQQLTQSLEVEQSDIEETAEVDSDVLVQKIGQDSQPHLPSSVSQQPTGEINWGLSKCTVPKSPQPSQSSSYPGMTFSSQPPSQLYLESSSQSQVPSPTHTQFGSSPAPLSPSSLTVSTPAGQAQQSWYNQGPATLPQQVKSGKAVNCDGLQPGFFARKKSEAASSSKGSRPTRHAPPVNMFRSGTLQINPAVPQLVPSDPRRCADPQVVDDVLLHHHHRENHTAPQTTSTAHSLPQLESQESQQSPQSSQSVASSSQDFSYPLQTQAPYQSQSLSQL